MGDGEKVTANKETFARIRERLAKEDGAQLSEADLARTLRVSRSRISMLLAGEEVTYGLLAKLVMPAIEQNLPDKLWEGFSLSDLIADDASTWIPDSPDSFPLRLNEPAHGHYLDHDRQRLGSVEWFDEAVTVEKVSAPRRGLFTLQGRIVNETGLEFAYEMKRLSIHLCVIHAVEKGGVLGLSGAFTHLYQGALCGTWTGTNIAWRPASYRFVISPVKLEDKQLEDICDRLPIDGGYKPRV